MSIFTCLRCGATTLDGLTDSWVEVKRLRRITSLLSGYVRTDRESAEVFCSVECAHDRELSAATLERDLAARMIREEIGATMIRVRLADGLQGISPGALERSASLLESAMLVWWGDGAFRGYLRGVLRFQLAAHASGWKSCTQSARNAVKLSKVTGTMYLYAVPVTEPIDLRLR